MQISVPRPIAFPLALALALSVPAFAADDPSTTPGSKAGIDRETGRLRATTVAEDQALARDAARLRAQAQNQRAPGVAALVRPATAEEALSTQQQHADGSVSMMVPESLDSEVRAYRDADGQLVVTHAGGTEVDHVEQ